MNETTKIKCRTKNSFFRLISNFKNDYQSLHVAIEFKLFKLSKNIIDRLPVSLLDSRDSKTNLTPLHFAIINDSEEIALQLINKLPPEKLYSVDIEFNATPLHFAIIKGFTNVAVALIEKLPLEGLDIGDYQGYIPFQIAVKNQQLEIAKQLMAKMSLKSLIYKNDKCVESPLITTYTDDTEEIFAYLIQKVVLAYEVDKNGDDIYFKILRENWDYFKEISNQLQ